MAERRLPALVLCLAAVPSFAAQPPSLELLEFLAEWQDENGQWADPFSVPDTDDEQGAAVENEQGEN